MDLMELIKQKKAALNSGKRQKTIKPAEGRSRYRILPGWRGAADPTFYHDFGQHFIKGTDGTLKAVYVCVDKTYGKPCQVCSAIEHGIVNSSDDEIVKTLKDAKASGRILLNVLHIDGDNPNEPQILEVGPGIFGDVLNIIQEWGNILELDTGKDIIIERTGKGLNTKYSVQIAAKSAPVPADVMKKLANLDEYVQQESEEQAKRALANLHAVAGLLGAPVATKPRPAALSDLMVDDEDPTLEIPGEPKSATPAASAKAVEVAPAPAAAASTGDSELDDLLAELG